MALIDEIKLRKYIVKEITELEKSIDLAIEEHDEKIECYFMGSQTTLAKLLQKLNDI